MHLTPHFLAAKRWRMKNPKAKPSELPELEPTEQDKQLVRKFDVKVAPLVNFYVDKYMPIRDNTDVLLLSSTLRHKFYLD